MPNLSKAEVIAILSAQGINSIDDLATQITSTQMNSGVVDLPVATNPAMLSGKTPEQLASSWVIKVWKLSPHAIVNDLDDIRSGGPLKTAIESAGGPEN
jgi:hypothetical protein